MLAGINRILHDKLQGQYVTAVYAYVDLEARRIRHASAGHPAPLLFKADGGRVLEPGESGLLMGFAPEIHCVTSEKIGRAHV